MREEEGKEDMIKDSCKKRQSGEPGRGEVIYYTVIGRRKEWIREPEEAKKFCENLNYLLIHFSTVIYDKTKSIEIAINIRNDLCKK